MVCVCTHVCDFTITRECFWFTIVQRVVQTHLRMRFWKAFEVAGIAYTGKILLGLRVNLLFITSTRMFCNYFQNFPTSVAMNYPALKFGKG